MINLDFDNYFVFKISFLNTFCVKLVCARNQDDATSTLASFYKNYKIDAIFKLNDLMEVYDNISLTGDTMSYLYTLRTDEHRVYSTIKAIKPTQAMDLVITDTSFVLTATEIIEIVLAAMVIIENIKEDILISSKVINEV